MSEEGTLPKHPIESCWQLDGSRHCFRCRQTWHEKDGIWPDFGECVEKLTPQEELKQTKAALTQALEEIKKLDTERRWSNDQITCLAAKIGMLGEPSDKVIDATLMLLEPLTSIGKAMIRQHSALSTEAKTKGEKEE